MSAAMLLVIWCGGGGLVGAAVGSVKGRPLAGLFLGAFLTVLGWVMILEAPRRQSSTSVPAGVLAASSSGGVSS